MPFSSFSLFRKLLQSCLKEKLKVLVIWKNIAPTPSLGNTKKQLIRRGIASKFWALLFLGSPSLWWISTPAGRALPTRSWYNCLWYSSLYPHAVKHTFALRPVRDPVHYTVERFLHPAHMDPVTPRGMALIDGGMAEATACQHSTACTGTERGLEEVSDVRTDTPKFHRFHLGVEHTHNQSTGASKRADLRWCECQIDSHKPTRYTLLKRGWAVAIAEKLVQLLEGEMVLLPPVPARHVLGPHFPLNCASNLALRARQSLFLPCSLHASLPGLAEPAVSKSGNLMKPGT